MLQSDVKPQKSKSDSSLPAAQSEILDACQNLDEAEAAAAIITATTIELNAVITVQNSKMAAVREHDSEIKSLRDRIARHEKRLEDWATANREALFGDKQSLPLRQAVIGFQKSPRSLDLVEGSSWSDVLLGLLGKGWGSLLTKLMTGSRKYVRIKPEIDKVKILEDSKPEIGRLTEKDLKQMFVKVVRRESFYVEPRLSSPA